MEGNQAHLLAGRMKKGKGRSWSPTGARHMAKVRELLANQELKPWCYRQEHIPRPEKTPRPTPPLSTGPCNVYKPLSQLSMDLFLTNPGCSGCAI